MKKILLSSAVAVLLLTGCGEEKPAETKAVEQVKVEAVKKAETPKVEVEEKSPEQKLVEQVKSSTTVVAEKIAQESKKVAEIGTEAVKSVSEKLATTTEEVSKEVAQKAVEAKDKIEESLNTIVATKNEVNSSSDDLASKGKGLYLKCAGCHGTNGEKPALGKSQVIKGWTSQQVVDALKGYKDDSYGGVMKGVMKAQVAALSDEDINALGSYISTLK